MRKFYNFLILLCIINIWSCQTEKKKTESFNSFLKSLERTSINNRSKQVQEYLLSIEQTPIIEGKKSVHFILFDLVDSVKIQGDLQKGWSTPKQLTKIDCGEKNFFYISYNIPSNSQLEYQFIADGKTRLDPLNKKVELNYEYGDRNVFQMPDFKKSPYLEYRSKVKKGRIVFQNLKSQNDLFMDRKLEIYLPPDYDNTQSYKVLLVNDGKIKLYRTPFKNVIDNLIHEKAIEPIIVVFIPTIERDKEYCNQNIEYAKYIVEEVIPIINSNYSTKVGSTNWAIMGSSMGGNISMTTGFLYPDVIGNIGAQGGAGGGVSWCNLDSLLLKYSSKKEIYPLKNIFASVGTFDLEIPEYGIHFLKSARIFKQKLDSLGIEHEYFEYNDGHRDSNWNHSIDDILIQFFEK